MSYLGNEKWSIPDSLSGKSGGIASLEWFRKFRGFRGFAPDSGLYVQNYKPEWEYPVHLEFYEPDGTLAFHHDAGVTIGGENAWALP